MKLLASYTRKMIACGVALGVMSLVAQVQAQNMTPAKAKVQAVRGQVQYKENAAAPWAPLKAGTMLTAGAVIETGQNSQADLLLRQIRSVVRVTPETRLSLDKMNFSDAGDETIVEAEFDLKAGTIVGNVRKLVQASRYDVKIPNGVVGIRGTEYKVSANGVVHVVTGSVRVTYTVPGRPAVQVEVKAGETFYPPTATEDARIVKILPTDIVWLELKDLRDEMFPPDRPKIEVTPLEPVTVIPEKDTSPVDPHSSGGSPPPPGGS